MEPLIPKHGGYRNLKSFQVAQLVYDVTIRFCNRYINQRSRTHDQMVQAARSGVQNIVEGSLASAASKKMELKLTNVARASLEELRMDYEDYLRHRNLQLWPDHDPRRKELIARRCRTADEVAAWVKEVALRENGQNGQKKDGLNGQYGLNGHNNPQKVDSGSIPSMPSIPSTKSQYPALSANTALILIGVACTLLDRQITRLAQDFENEGGFTERLYRVRTESRRRSK